MRLLQGISGLLRQCKSRPGLRPDIVYASSAEPKQKSSLTAEQLARRKLNSECRKRGKWGHWHSDHIDTGKLKPNTPSRDMKEDTSGKVSVTFQMVNVDTYHEISSEQKFSLKAGQLLDDSAQYYGIGEQ